jgi:hypothetical protein
VEATDQAIDGIRELIAAASAVHVAGVEEWLRGAIERRRQWR